MWPFRTVELERKLYEARRELAEYKARETQTKYNEQESMRLARQQQLAIGAVAAPRQRLTTDLPMTRVADLAGYLGRVHEQLTFAALLTATEIKDGAELQAISNHLRNAAAKAAKVQLDLLQIIQQERDDEAERAAKAQAELINDAMRSPRASQWTREELERATKAQAESINVNRIAEICDACAGTGTIGDHTCLNCGGSGRVPS